MITVKVDTRVAKKTQSEKITAGSVGIKVEFEFSQNWTGLSKWAVFSDGAESRDVLLIENICEIPPECIKISGRAITVGLYGTDGEETVIPTIYCNIGKVDPGTELSGYNPEDFTPSIVDQLSAAVQRAVDTAQSVRNDADAGEFDGPPGPEGPRGMDGPEGRQGIQGNPGADGADGYSPVVSISEIEGGHSVAITDKDHPEGQTFDVMDGQGGGASSWSDLTDKPFTTIGGNLKVVGGALTVDTAEAVEEDNTKPITSAAVYTEVGNIAALLAAI